MLGLSGLWYGETLGGAGEVSLDLLGKRGEMGLKSDVGMILGVGTKF